MPDYWFFFSYARVDGDNQYLVKFFSELATEVRRQAGLRLSISIDDIGFFDRRSVDVGENWDVAICDALQTSQVFIALYSRGYFNSEYSGKEFQVFRSRIQALDPNGHIVPLILPILWDPPQRFARHIPACLTNIQFDQAQLGQVYAQHGLFQMLRLKKYEDDYKEFLDRLAAKIVEGSEPRLLPPLQNLPSLKDVQSAFHEPVASPAPFTLTNVEVGDVQEHLGPRTAQFVFVAGTEVELNQYRPGANCYGKEGGKSWRPWYPPNNKAVGILSQETTAAENVFYDNLPIDVDLIQKLRKAEDTNTMVILVVDPWSMHVEAYKQKMDEYDAQRYVNCAVLIPWNEGDDATEKSKDALRNLIDTSFFRFSENTTYFRYPIMSAEDFKNELAATICEIRRKLIRRADIQRSIQPGPLMPGISGPGSIS